MATKKDKFVIKKRVYYLNSGRKPVAFQIKSKHKDRSPLLWQDPEEGKIRELRYATNMDTPFVDEQEEKGGRVTLEHIWFRDGVLAVNEKQIALQKFLDIHPDNVKNGGKVFFEYDPDAKAREEIQSLEAAAEAMSAAKDLDIDDASAIVYSRIGNTIKSYSSSEVKRDVLSLAISNPNELLSLLEDETLAIDWLAYQALNYKVIVANGPIMTMAGSKKKLLQAKPGSSNEESLSEFFMTDDGMATMEIVKADLKKLLG